LFAEYIKTNVAKQIIIIKDSADLQKIKFHRLSQPRRQDFRDLIATKTTVLIT